MIQPGLGGAQGGARWPRAAVIAPREGVKSTPLEKIPQKVFLSLT